MRLPNARGIAVQMTFSAIALFLGIVSWTAASDEKKISPPAVGEEARDFELAGIDGNKVKLSSVIEEGPVVLIVLRGYPGYQCPLCTGQVGQFLGRADRLQAAGASVIFIYPGPADRLAEHAAEFVGDRKLPKSFRLLIDPDYSFTKAYALRWNALRETAYPATFVIDKNRKVLFAKVSKSHGDRASVEDAIRALRAE